jgi:sterol desaturase/sphingolipid hydroxylase (fatty acid hydroxylase superfamily)
MDIETLLTLAFVSIYLGLAALERLLPGYRYVERPHWVLRGVAWFALTFIVSSLVPLLTDEWLGAYSLLDLSALGVWGALPALLGYQLIGYAWHRMLHAVPALWRIHQLHHSSERIDIWSAMRFHPLDIAGWTLVSSLSAVWVFGVALEAAIVHALLANAAAWFGHTNVRTPRWLGYLVARPENHALHHARGIHRKNYADLPIVDLLFGTFENPAHAPEQAGFWDGASEETLALLLCKELGVETPAPPPSDALPSA